MKSIWALTLLTMIALTIRVGFNSKKAQKSAIALITTPRWIINVIIIILFIFWTYHETKHDEPKTTRRIVESLKKGIIAFIIALLAELGLTITPFWLIFMISYYLEGWS